MANSQLPWPDVKGCQKRRTKRFCILIDIPTATQFVAVNAPSPDEVVYSGLATSLDVIVASGPCGKAVFKDGHMVCLQQRPDWINPWFSG
ncbi:MAG: hypothetical protein AAGH53_05555 [Pseudomonadota bacterium]